MKRITGLIQLRGVIDARNLPNGVDLFYKVSQSLAVSPRQLVFARFGDLNRSVFAAYPEIRPKRRMTKDRENGIL